MVEPDDEADQDAALLLDCLNRIIACAEGIAETASVKVGGEGADARLLSACLLARSISTGHAVVHLIGLDHVVEARMLVRSMLENVFYIYRLAGDDGSAFASKMMIDDEIHQSQLGKAIVTARGAEVRSRVNEIAEELLQKTRGKRWP